MPPQGATPMPQQPAPTPNTTVEPDDWFTGDDQPAPAQPATPPPAQQDDDWFAGDTSTPQQGAPSMALARDASTPPQSQNAAMPVGQSAPSDDDWFTGEPQSVASMPSQSQSAPAQPQPAPAQPQPAPASSRQPATTPQTDEHDWFTQEQGSVPSTPPQSRNATPQPTAGQDPWADTGNTTGWPDDGTYTPATDAGTTPATDDPWADPTPAGEWEQPTQAMQAPTMPLQRPAAQSYAPQTTPSQPDIDNDDDNDDDKRSIWKPLLVILACVLTLGLTGFGGYYGYTAYRNASETHAKQEASAQALKELDKSKAAYEADKKEARALITKMRTGPVKDDPDVVKQADALDKLASRATPRTKQKIGEADTQLNGQYATASKTYRTKVDAKCGAVSKTLADLASQSDQLASAPDSTEKTTMQSLAKKWRDGTVTEDTYAEASKAAADLQNAVNAVRAAKQQADAAAQQAQQQAQQQAEQQAQQQAQRQQQQQQQAQPQKRSATTPKRPTRSGSGSSQKRYVPRSTPAPTRAPAPQPAPQPAQPPVPSGESGVNLG